MTPLLAADSIAKAFGNRRVLTSARLEAQQGAITFVAGRNGAGKSTLMRIVAGVLPPDFGVIRYAGSTFDRPLLFRLARKGLFYLPDRGILSPSKNLGDQLNAIAQRFGRPPIAAAAEELGVSELLNAPPHSYSTGELRRAEICLAVVRQPACLIADEPLRGIDPIDAELVLVRLRSMAAAGCAIVISGHDVTGLMDVVDSVVWVTSGTSYLFASPSEAAGNDQFRREYLTGSWK